MARAQVDRGVRARRAEAAEVDHPLDARGGGRLAEVDGGGAVALGEVLARARTSAHGMDEVVGRAHALERVAEARARDGVALVEVDAGRQAGRLGPADE